MSLERAVPIVNLPNLYMNGLNLNSSGATLNVLMTVDAGQCRDSSNTYDMVLNSQIFLNLENPGINGIDSGVVVPNTAYWIYLISDPVTLLPTASIASLNPVQPLMPFGYSAYRKIGYVATVFGFVSLDRFVTFGSGNEKTFFYINSVNAAVGGLNSTSPTVINLVNRLPLLGNVVCDFDVNVQSSAAAGGYAFVSFVPGNSTNPFTASVETVGGAITTTTGAPGQTLVTDQTTSILVIDGQIVASCNAATTFLTLDIVSYTMSL